MEKVVLVTEGNYCVVAVHDEAPCKPEWQGLPSVLISHNWRDTSITESWPGAVDTDVIQRALNELDDDVFDRWVRIFGDELVNRAELGIEEDEEIEIHVLDVNGYSQGDNWTLLSWMPKGYETPDPNEDELVNWARGDAYVLNLEKKVTWTTDDEDFNDVENWEMVDSCGGFYVRRPEKSEWVIQTAKAMIPKN